MALLTDYQYYENDGNAPMDANWGSYQYVSLEDIINNFMLMYQGNHEIINNLQQYQVTFFAKRGIQELNYDALREVKALELDVCDDLRFILPSNYVNWVRISIYENGILRPLSENIQINSAKAYLQDNNCNLLFDSDGNVLSGASSKIDIDRISGQKKSIYLNGNSIYDGAEGYNIDGQWYFDFQVGARYGLETETANANPTFKIDRAAGVINFSSGVAGKKIILEYVSDGMETNVTSSEGSPVFTEGNIKVHKFFEQFLYDWIAWSIVEGRYGIQEYIITRFRKRKAASWRNAKIRLNDIHPSRLLMNMRGQDKVIK